MRRLLLLAWALGLAGLAGCFDPIVGARCADGYVPCHGRCVAVCTADGGGAQGDARDGQAITGDGGAPLGDAGGGGAGDGLSGDAGPHADGGPISGSDGGPGSDGGAISDGGGKTDASAPSDGASAGDAAAPVDTASSDAALLDSSSPDSISNDAAAADTGAADDASAADAGAADTLAADAAPPADGPPPIDCGALTYCPPLGCVSLMDDPDNCGACNFSCGSGLCVSGVCQQRQAGHLVVIGHDYAVSRPSMDNLVGNAVFLAPGTSVRVLAYHGAATAEEIAGTDAAIQRVANSTGRTWTKTVAAANDVQTSLAFADVFVIYAQAGATDATLLALGSDWATALSDFVQGGKTIVVLEGFYANAGTYQIVQQANLFHATGRMEATGQTMVVARAGDAVATRVPQTYRGERSTVWFATMDQTVVVQVATDAGTLPVVIHLVF